MASISISVEGSRDLILWKTWVFMLISESAKAMSLTVLKSTINARRFRISLVDARVIKSIM